MEYTGDPRAEARPSRGIFAGFVVIVIAVIVLVGVVSTLAYQSCTAEFWRDDWLYPGAQVVGETAQFMSTQQRILLTSDSPAAIEAWYAGVSARLMREGVVSGDTRNVLSPPPIRLTADPDGAGTRIVMTKNCP